MSASAKQDLSGLMWSLSSTCPGPFVQTILLKSYTLLLFDCCPNIARKIINTAKQIVNEGNGLKGEELKPVIYCAHCTKGDPWFWMYCLCKHNFPRQETGSFSTNSRNTTRIPTVMGVRILWRCVKPYNNPFIRSLKAKAHYWLLKTILISFINIAAVGQNSPLPT